MTTNQMVKLFAEVIDGIPQNAGKTIRRHYGLKRSLTFSEIRAEIENLQRKRKAGTLDTKQEHLFAALDLKF
jgi:hypothetical protein